MTDSGELCARMEVDDDLSSAMGTETLIPRASTMPLEPRSLTTLSYNFPWAFHTLVIPAMSSECERVFSSAKNC